MNLKTLAAQHALQYIEEDTVVGVGTGSTVNCFIEALATSAIRIQGAVASSKQTEARLKQHGVPVFQATAVSDIPIYVDSADEINPHLQMIKGGGGALTGEKILAAISKKFICIADESKRVELLGKFPVALEVIPMARSFVAREIVKLGANPEYREGFVTDYGNIILDVYNLQILEPYRMEATLNQIPGVVCNGIFAEQSADLLLCAGPDGVAEIRA